jgi:hypothetical protein
VVQTQSAKGHQDVENPVPVKWLRPSAPRRAGGHGQKGNANQYSPCGSHGLRAGPHRAAAVCGATGQTGDYECWSESAVKQMAPESGLVSRSSRAARASMALTLSPPAAASRRACTKGCSRNAAVSC